MRKIFFYSAIFCLLVAFVGCKKDGQAVQQFTYEGKWTVSYIYPIIPLTGNFIATFKSNGKWDYSEGSMSKTDVGTWSSSGNSITFKFTSNGDAVYQGSKDTNITLNGTMTSGTAGGIWTAVKN